MSLTIIKKIIKNKILTKKYLKIFSLFYLLLFITPPIEANPGLVIEQVKEIQLKNGMKFLLLSRKGAPVFSAYIRVKVGGVDEESGQTGIAHLLEHMAFKGTSQIGTLDYEKEKKLLSEVEILHDKFLQASPDEKSDLKKQLDQKIQEANGIVNKEEFSRIYMRNGASNLNATTSQDLTSYFVTLPSHKLELWAYLESSRLKDPVFREFYSELDVVLEERRMRVEDSPFGKLYESFKEMAFKKSPYHRPTIGYPQDIQKLSAKDLRRFYEHYYVPSNMVGTLVGDFDLQEAESIVRRYFGSLKSGKKVSSVRMTEPEPKRSEIQKIQYPASPLMILGYLKPTIPDPDDYAFDVFDQIFCQGRSSRLYQNLVVTRKLATNVACSNSIPGARLQNLYFIFADIQKGHQAKEILVAIDEEFRKILSQGFSEREIEKAKRGLLSDWYYQMQGNENIAENLSYYEILTGSWKYILDHPQKISQVKQKDLIHLVKRYLKENRRKTAVLESIKQGNNP